MLNGLDRKAMPLQIRQEGTTQWLKLQQLLPELRGGGGGGGRSPRASSQRQQDTGPRASAFSRLGLPVDGNAPERKRSDRGAGSSGAPQRQEPVSHCRCVAPFPRCAMLLSAAAMPVPLCLQYMHCG